jgi:hypothetical protein
VIVAEKDRRIGKRTEDTGEREKETVEDRNNGEYANKHTHLRVWASCRDGTARLATNANLL